MKFVMHRRKACEVIAVGDGKKYGLLPVLAVGRAVIQYLSSGRRAEVNVTDLSEPRDSPDGAHDKSRNMRIWEAHVKARRNKYAHTELFSR